MPNNTNCPYYIVDCPTCKPMPNNTTTDTWEDALQNRVAALLDSYFPEHEDCECSRCLAFIYGIKEVMVKEIALAEKRGAERVIEAIPYELPLPTPQGLQGITLSPLKQTLKEKFLTNN